MTLGALVCSTTSAVTAAPATSGAPDRKAPAVGNQENLLELGLRARLHVELLDLDHVALRDTVLLATCLNDCVCHEIFSFVGTCENLTPASGHQAKFFPCVLIPQRQTLLPSWLGW